VRKSNDEKQVWLLGPSRFTGEQERKWVSQQLLPHLAQEAPRLHFSDIPRTYCQQKAQNEGRNDIQNADERNP
jgi:hypothetical protein